MLQPTSVCGYGGPRPKQPGTGPLTARSSSPVNSLQKAGQPMSSRFLTSGAYCGSNIVTKHELGMPLVQIRTGGDGRHLCLRYANYTWHKAQHRCPAPGIAQLLQSQLQGHDNELVCGKFGDGPTGGLPGTQCGTHSTTGMQLKEQRQPWLSA